ncbi:MAG: hypothetical protein WA638_07305, partial [Candidatus Acidiferrales bacterium]
MTKQWRAAFAFFAVLFFVVFSSQAQDFHGSIIGEVVDTSGARVPSAKIMARSQQTSLEREAIA